MIFTNELIRHEPSPAWSWLSGLQPLFSIAGKSRAVELFSDDSWLCTFYDLFRRLTRQLQACAIDLQYHMYDVDSKESFSPEKRVGIPGVVITFDFPRRLRATRSVTLEWNEACSEKLTMGSTSNLPTPITSDSHQNSNRISTHCMVGRDTSTPLKKEFDHNWRSKVGVKAYSWTQAYQDPNRIQAESENHGCVGNRKKPNWTQWSLLSYQRRVSIPPLI